VNQIVERWTFTAQSSDEDSIRSRLHFITEQARKHARLMPDDVRLRPTDVRALIKRPILDYLRFCATAVLDWDANSISNIQWLI